MLISVLKIYFCNQKNTCQFFYTLSNIKTYLSTLYINIMKTILAIWNSGGKGKSSTLRDFANLLIKTYTSHVPIFPIPVLIHATDDFTLVVEISGIIVGIETKGDPKTNLKQRLLVLTDKFNCDIILCTTRTRGETVKAVDDVANTRGYQTIWTSTYQIGYTSLHDLANKSKAEHIMDLLHKLGLL